MEGNFGGVFVKIALTINIKNDRIKRKEKKMREIIFDLNKNPIGIKNENIIILECESKIASKIIKENHYSHKATPNHFKSFLINGGLGAIQLGFGIRPHKKNNISSFITKDNYCEFDRMWLSDELPKFSESQTIGLLIRYIKLVYPNIKFIITYSDTSVGNQGTIYKATNAILAGEIPCDFYVLESGERVHPVTMWHRHKTRSWDFLKKTYPNIKHIRGDGYVQKRYLYILDKKIKKEFEKEKTSK